MEKNHTVALIGCGYWGANYVNTLAEMPNIRLKYLCDIKEPQKVSLRRKAEKFATDYFKVIDDPEVESVIIATPTANHYEHARAALTAGKNVLVEKPMTPTTAQARVLTDEALKQGKTLMVGHIFMYHPAVTRFKEYLDQGELGKIKSMTARRLSLGPVRTSENVIWDLMPHDISMFLYLNNTRPMCINAVGQAFNRRLEDIATLSIKFDNEAFGSITASWMSPLKVRDLTIVGDKKMGIFDDTGVSKLAIYDKGATLNGSPANPADYAVNYREGDVTLPHVSAESPLAAQCKHFFECIETGREPRSNGRNGELVVKILEAADESLHSHGKEVKL